MNSTEIVNASRRVVKGRYWTMLVLAMLAQCSSGSGGGGNLGNASSELDPIVVSVVSFTLLAALALSVFVFPRLSFAANAATMHLVRGGEAPWQEFNRVWKERVWSGLGVSFFTRIYLLLWTIPSAIVFALLLVGAALLSKAAAWAVGIPAFCAFVAIICNRYYAYGLAWFISNDHPEWSTNKCVGKSVKIQANHACLYEHLAGQAKENAENGE